jgi:hypothetical protein
MTKGEIRVVRFGDVDVANEQAATRDSREQRTGAVRVTHSGLLAELTELDRMRRDDGFKQTDYLLHKRGYDGTSFSDSGAHRWFKTRLERVRGAPDIKLEFRFQARATDVEVV